MKVAWMALISQHPLNCALEIHLISFTNRSRHVYNRLISLFCKKINAFMKRFQTMASLPQLILIVILRQQILQLTQLETLQPEVTLQTAPTLQMELTLQTVPTPPTGLTPLTLPWMKLVQNARHYPQDQNSRHSY